MHFIGLDNRETGLLTNDEPQRVLDTDKQTDTQTDSY